MYNVKCMMRNLNYANIKHNFDVLSIRYVEIISSILTNLIAGDYFRHATLVLSDEKLSID
jgi:hypothetical protein